MPKPYRAGGNAKLGTNLDGLKSAVHTNGSINDPSDTDQSWSVTIAFPWNGLATYSGHMVCPPLPGDQWRVNFSRVEWLYDIIDGQYRKIPRDMRPEDNWVWSPQGVVDMHRPWRWGVVEFCETHPDSLKINPIIEAQQQLMAVYEAQRTRIQNGLEAVADPAALNLPVIFESLTIKVGGNENWSAEIPWKDADGNTVICRVDNDQRFTWV